MPLPVISLIRKGIGLGLVLGIAAVSGHVVQNAAQARHGALQDGTPRISSATVVMLSGEAVGATRSDPVALAPSLFGQGCNPTLDLMHQTGAVVVVTLSAPCHADGIVRLSHGGAEVTMRVPQGRPLRMVWPALEAQGGFVASFADGRRIAAAVPVPDLAALRRFAVSWKGAAGVQIAGRTAAVQVSGETAVPDAPDGWVTTLGDAALPDPMMAQIYTYPPEDRTPVDVAVRGSAAACGTRMKGATLLSQGGQAEGTLLSVTLPDCDAPHAVMHLKNLDRDVKLAAY